MSDPVTNNLSLVLPTQGGDLNVWGTVLNDGVIAALDSYLGSSTAISITGSDVAITASQFGASSAFILSGTLSGNRNLTVPLSPNSLTVACAGKFLVVNNTTGAFNVTVKTVASGSTGVTVPQGGAVLLSSDGTNVSYANFGLPGYALASNGNPNSQLAGTAASVNTNAAIAFDYANKVLYVCTTTGTASTAVWSLVQISQWTTAARPVSPANGQIGYNTTLSLYEFWNGAAWVQPSIAFPPVSSFKNLSVKVASNTTVAVVADAVTIGNGNGDYRTVPVNVAINMATTGAGGLDAGSIIAATFYAIYAIAKPDGTVSALASTSATAPTLPSGYTFAGRIGWVRTAPLVAQLMGTWQLGRQARYVVGLAQTTQLPALDQGIKGNPSAANGMVAIATASYVPTSASVIDVICVANSNSAFVCAGPNNNFAGIGSVGNSPPLSLINGTSGFSGTSQTVMGAFLLESSSIYWASSGQASVAILCYGWEDNI